jgi:hypothetical protein
MPAITLNIVEAIVVTHDRGGPDTIILKTDMPGPVFPYEYPLELKITAAKGNGADYVRRHLGIEPEVIGVAPRPTALATPLIVYLPDLVDQVFEVEGIKLRIHSSFNSNQCGAYTYSDAVPGDMVLTDFLRQRILPLMQPMSETAFFNLVKVVTRNGIPLNRKLHHVGMAREQAAPIRER